MVLKSGKQLLKKISLPQVSRVLAPVVLSLCLNLQGPDLSAASSASATTPPISKLEKISAKALLDKVTSYIKKEQDRKKIFDQVASEQKLLSRYSITSAEELKIFYISSLVTEHFGQAKYPNFNIYNYYDEGVQEAYFSLFSSWLHRVYGLSPTLQQAMDLVNYDDMTHAFFCAEIKQGYLDMKKEKQSYIERKGPLITKNLSLIVQASMPEEMKVGKDYAYSAMGMKYFEAMFSFLQHHEETAALLTQYKLSNAFQLRRLCIAPSDELWESQIQEAMKEIDRTKFDDYAAALDQGRVTPEEEAALGKLMDIANIKELPVDERKVLYTKIIKWQEVYATFGIPAQFETSMRAVYVRDHNAHLVHRYMDKKNKLLLVPDVDLSYQFGLLAYLSWLTHGKDAVPKEYAMAIAMVETGFTRFLESDSHVGYSHDMMQVLRWMVYRTIVLQPYKELFQSYVDYEFKKGSGLDDKDPKMPSAKGFEHKFDSHYKGQEAMLRYFYSAMSLYYGYGEGEVGIATIRYNKNKKYRDTVLKRLRRLIRHFQKLAEEDAVLENVEATTCLLSPGLKAQQIREGADPVGMNSYIAWMFDQEDQSYADASSPGDEPGDTNGAGSQQEMTSDVGQSFRLLGVVHEQEVPEAIGQPYVLLDLSKNTLYSLIHSGNIYRALDYHNFVAQQQEVYTLFNLVGTFVLGGKKVQLPIIGKYQRLQDGKYQTYYLCDKGNFEIDSIAASQLAEGTEVSIKATNQDGSTVSLSEQTEHKFYVEPGASLSRWTYDLQGKSNEAPDIYVEARDHNSPYVKPSPTAFMDDKDKDPSVLKRMDKEHVLWIGGSEVQNLYFAGVNNLGFRANASEARLNLQKNRNDDEKDLYNVWGLNWETTAGGVKRLKKHINMFAAQGIRAMVFWYGYSDAYLGTSPEAYRNNIEEIAKLCGQYDIEPIFVTPEYRETLDPNKKSYQKLSNLGYEEYKDRVDQYNQELFSLQKKYEASNLRILDIREIVEDKDFRGNVHLKTKVIKDEVLREL